jgi:hypothetical protein
VPDILEKLPGRGIWVSADRDALDKAVKKNLFARAAKAAGHGARGPGRPGRGGLADRVVDLIALKRARPAGGRRVREGQGLARREEARS